MQLRCNVDETVSEYYTRSTDKKLDFNRLKVRSTDQMLAQMIKSWLQLTCDLDAT